jgi:hypothetical protein
VHSGIDLVTNARYAAASVQCCGLLQLVLSTGKLPEYRTVPLARMFAAPLAWWITDSISAVSLLDDDPVCLGQLLLSLCIRL